MKNVAVHQKLLEIWFAGSQIINCEQTHLMLKIHSEFSPLKKQILVRFSEFFIKIKKKGPKI